MSKSPLSGAFAGSSEPAKKNKKNGALLLISGIALATSIGGVFAATTSITLNGSSALEFGQGIGAVDSCAATADVTMTQIWDATAQEFYVGDVTVTFASGCNNKNATVTLLDASGVPLVDAASANATFTATVSSNAVTNSWSASDAIIAGAVEDVTVTTAD
jgi:hypothetical protein